MPWFVLNEALLSFITGCQFCPRVLSLPDEGLSVSVCLSVHPSGAKHLA